MNKYIREYVRVYKAFAVNKSELLRDVLAMLASKLLDNGITKVRISEARLVNLVDASVERYVRK